MTGRVLAGDCRAMMATLDADIVQCVVTSPPYFGLRDYDASGQLGLEPVPDCLGWATGAACGECFVCHLVDVFRSVRRVLRPDGLAWLNLGDSYAGSGRGGSPGGPSSTLAGTQHEHAMVRRGRREVSDHQRRHTPPNTGARDTTSGLNASSKRHAGANGGTWTKAPAGFKQKDLMGIPWRVALALQADGWWLRQDIIWSKPNPMPESITDRCTKAHEYLFLLSKSERYYFDADAIAEPAAPATVARMAQNVDAQTGSTRAHGGIRADRPMKSVGASETRNRRSVWSIPTSGFRGAHFATFPPALVEPCILASTRPGDTVLDPFMGSGTTGMVAQRLGRQWIGCELNPENVAMAEDRIRRTNPGLGLA